MSISYALNVAEAADINKGQTSNGAAGYSFPFLAASLTMPVSSCA
jgi:hypothetical protein